MNDINNSKMQRGKVLTTTKTNIFSQRDTLKAKEKIKAYLQQEENLDYIVDSEGDKYPIKEILKLEQLRYVVEIFIKHSDYYSSQQKESLQKQLQERYLLIHRENFHYFNRHLFNSTQGMPLEELIESNIALDPHVSLQSLAELGRVSTKTIQRCIKKMPHIERKGTPRNGYWIINEK